MSSKEVILPLLIAILLAGCTGAPPSPAASNSGTPAPSASPDWAADFRQEVAAYRAENEGEQTPDETCQYLMKCMASAAEAETLTTRGVYPTTASFLVPKYFDVQPSCPSGAAYVYKSVKEPKNEFDITCPSHHRTFNSLVGFR